MTQGEALEILKTGANIFLTGEPGSGKTHVVNTYVQWLREHSIEPSITAATGIAATHVGGQTLHAWSGIGIHESLSRAEVDHIASKEHIAKRIQKSSVLLIEEISMLSANVFEMADRVCREVRRVDRPFGGLTVILVGDFFQLPPIMRRNGDSVDESHTPFVYSSPVWRELNPIICYLSEQYRQDDEAFLGVLSAIRSGSVEELHIEQLTARTHDVGNIDTSVPKLFSHNADVDRLNAEELSKLPGLTSRYTMTAQGKESYIEALKRGCLSPETLELKKGATVMFTKNSPQGKFVNGSLGTVVAFNAEGLPIVELAASKERRVTAEPMLWQLEERGKVLASISQVPLRLAYAMTVHKSQGMSMDRAVIDLSRAFEYGQGYVALSRVRRLSGVHLTGLNRRALEVHPDILEKDVALRAASEEARGMFSAMDSRELENMQERFISAMGGKEERAVVPQRRKKAVRTRKQSKVYSPYARKRMYSKTA